MATLLWLTSRSAFDPARFGGIVGSRPADLLARVDDFIIPEPNTGCWIWGGKIGDAGYGIIEVGGKTKRAHRIVYVLLKGPIPERLTLDHLCFNKWCVNPEHLEPVTRAENKRRSLDAVALRARTLCNHGHPLDHTIQQKTKTGRVYMRRFCIVCRRLSDQRRHVRKAA